jgi:hypothetical protein
MMIGLIPAARCSGQESAQTDSTPPLAELRTPVGRHLTGAEEEVRVDLVQGLAGVRIEKAYGLRKELFLVVLGGGATMGAVSQVSEVAQQFSDVGGLRSGHVCLPCCSKPSSASDSSQSRFALAGSSA